jgi:hypothetical protein
LRHIRDGLGCCGFLRNTFLGKKIYSLELALFRENIKTAGNCFPTVFLWSLWFLEPFAEFDAKVFARYYQFTQKEGCKKTYCGPGDRQDTGGEPLLGTYIGDGGSEKSAYCSGQNGKFPNHHTDLIGVAPGCRLHRRRPG